VTTHQSLNNEHEHPLEQQSCTEQTRLTATLMLSCVLQVLLG